MGATAAIAPKQAGQLQNQFNIAFTEKIWKKQAAADVNGCLPVILLAPAPGRRQFPENNIPFQLLKNFRRSAPDKRRLPVAPVLSAQDHSIIFNHRPSTMQHINRLLLIDDDEITNYLHKALIDQIALANEVVALGGAEQALAYIAKSSQDSQRKNTQMEIILLDINMPGMDGFEFLEAFKARQLPDHFKIFMVSSSQNAGDIQQAKEHRVCGYVSKPLTEQKLLAIMEKAKQQRQECLY